MWLRPAKPADIDFIGGIEARPENDEFINAWPADLHRRRLEDPDYRYLVIEAGEGAIGYAILAGLSSPHSIQLVRVALDKPGGGRGRAVCECLLEEVFERLRAHRFHLDLFEANVRAEHLYASVGFLPEGTLRDAERRGSRFRSLKLMAMLRPDYMARRRT